MILREDSVRMKHAYYYYATLFACCICGLCPTSASGSYVTNSWADGQQSHRFVHMVVDKNTGKIYVGGENRIYQLTSVLSQEREITTGPKPDNKKCFIGANPCTDTVSTNSITTAMTIDYEHSRLLTCTNLHQGSCMKRHLDDITVEDPGILEPVVPNDEAYSVVVLIAPGPAETNNVIQPNVLYIASTYYKGIYSIPAMASRKLTDFTIAYKNAILGSTSIKVQAAHVETFPIEYVYGFSHETFTYFIAVHKESIGATNYVTRLIRICQKDKKYRSYAEVPLECNSSGTNYNLAQDAYLGTAGKDLTENLHIPVSENVLYVTFAVGRPNENTPLEHSAMCSYSMRDIIGKFTSNIRMCFAGTGNIGPDHIIGRRRCTTSPETIINDNYCGESEQNYYIAGTTPIRETAAITFPSTLVTSIAVTKTFEYTVAFMGTSTGHLYKAVVETGSSATLYDNNTMEAGVPVRKDMLFDRAEHHLYVMTSNRVNRVAVQGCSQYTSCDTCLGAKDPYCGWCALQTKCSLRSDCTHRNDAKGWLPYKNQECTIITRVEPSEISMNQRQIELYIYIRNLPRVTDGQYTCTFSRGSFSMKTMARPIDGHTGVSCKTPQPNTLPAIPTGKDYLVMKLSVSVEKNSQALYEDFVAKEFTFFDCQKHHTCTQCTNTTFKCSWCVQSHNCTHNSESCHQQFIISAKDVTPSSRAGPQHCPRIERYENEIRVASGNQHVVSVDTSNLLEFMKTNLVCEFRFPSPINTIRRNGFFRSSGKIECDPGSPVKFEYRENSHSQNVPFVVNWRQSSGTYKAIDNPTNIQVQIYKCYEMAKDCGMCLTMPSKYDCGWCHKSAADSGSTCQIRSQCQSSGLDWRERSQVCLNARITSFQPMFGPVDGGTDVIIRGQNLGKVFSDIRDNVLVAGVQCTPYADRYIPASVIICKTGKSLIGPKRGNVKVTVATTVVAESAGEFSYVVPVVSSVYPLEGPKSGGTNLNISGKYLNTGTSVVVRVGSRDCLIIEQTDGRIVCKNPPLGDPVVPKSVNIVLSFDMYAVNYREQFYYVIDPVIDFIFPMKSILSGGLSIRVTGKRLNSILQPRMFVDMNGTRAYGNCDLVTSTTMTCYSPNVSSTVVAGIENSLPVEYGFIMDDVAPPKTGRIFKLYPDPVFDAFKGGVKFFQRKSEYLTINGKHLKSGFVEDDVVVHIGTAVCNVTSIADTQLNCITPKDGLDSLGKQPLVVVRVGRYFSKEIGRLDLDGQSSLTTNEDLIWIIVGGAGGAGVLLIVIIVVVVIMYRRKSKENNRVMKRMQNQMDVLESRVAKECKEAFAELQTDMSEITSDLSGVTGIPFHDYKSFCMKVLFPNAGNEDDHPVMRDLDMMYSSPDFEKGLRLFSQLLCNKTFLLLFIRTLENNKYFSMRDRVNVASLISVALQPRMEYHTDILKTLLADLIEKSVEGRNHPKLLLRRTESVAEKMLTNWFTFLLYKFLKECAGEPLFMLFRAVKQQVEKGPVDAMTGEARYSLSEDKLIRHAADFKPMTINVLDMDIQYGNQMHPVKVLDCDTIDQVKEKILDTIYKNAPHSGRPSKEELDLEWRTGETGRIILQDDDVTTALEGDWRRTNTLAHYKVNEGAVMTFVPRQYTTLASDRSYAGSMKHGGYGSQRYVNVNIGGTPPMNRTASPGHVSLDIKKKKVPTATLR